MVYTDSVARERAGSSRLPSFPGSAVPQAESPGRKLWIRAAAVTAILVSLAYLVWRALFTIDLAFWWIAIPFLALEVHALVSLCFFAFSLWDIDAGPTADPVETTSARIAVLIPTYNEGREILLPAIGAAVALEPEHETWVLDDGGRPEVEQLATELGARYLARSEHSNAKAGNVNNALGAIDADFVAILDADHVAGPDFLRNTLGYFHDPRVALVQTPQDFFNLASFEHEDSEGPLAAPNDEPLYHEEALFYRAIHPGKNRWGAAFWCGTGAVLRMAALRQVGGVATSTLTEDIHTTIRLHRRGWKTVYHNEVLARGLAASTAEEFQLQRLRWGTGAMQVLRAENPITVPGLRLAQRIAYAATLLGWFDAWRSLGYLLVPIVVLFTGAMPIRADPLTFALAFGVTFVIQQAAMQLLSRRHHRFVLALVFGLVRMSPNLRATLCLVWPGQPRFQVTPKGRQASGQRRISPPWLLVALAVLSVSTAAWFILTLAGLSPTRYNEPMLAYGAGFWLVTNAVLLVVAIARVRSEKYGPEQRSSVRFPVALPGRLNGRACMIHEMSISGAQISVAGASVHAIAATGQPHVLDIELGAETLSVKALIRWQQWRRADGTLYGIEFAEGQTYQQARLSLALLNATTRPTGLEDARPEPAQKQAA